MNVIFILGPDEQTVNVTGLSNNELVWLKILTGRIKACSIVTGSIQHGIKLGNFTYSPFRKFMQEAGYSEEVAQADNLYRLTA